MFMSALSTIHIHAHVLCDWLLTCQSKLCGKYKLYTHCCQDAALLGWEFQSTKLVEIRWKLCDYSSKSCLTSPKTEDTELKCRIALSLAVSDHVITCCTVGTSPNNRSVK